MPFSLICLIFVAGLAILFIELFLPGSFLGFIGTAILVTSIVLAFTHHSAIYGFMLLLITMIIVPIVIIWWLKKVSLNTSQNLEDGYTAADESLTKLVGKTGVAITLLRPSGTAKIDNRRIDVTTENIVLPANTPIQVVKVEGMRVIVQATGTAPTEE